LGEMRITSPLDGVVSQRRLDPGALVGPTSSSGAILTVDEIDVLRLFVSANEADVQRLKLGQTAHVDLDAMPGRRFDGRVVRLAPSLDPATRTLDAEVQLPNRDGVLRAGMYGRAAIVTGIHPGALTVPVGAVQISNNRSFVYVLRGDRVQRREVQLGVDGEDWLEIRSGLQADDEAVSAGLEGPSDRARARPAGGVGLFGNPGGPGGARVKPPASTVKD